MIRSEKMSMNSNNVKKYCFIVLILTVVLTFGCSNSSDNEYTRPNGNGNRLQNKKAERANMEAVGIPWDEGFDAKEWIKEIKVEELILNRFKSKKEALQFVENLYLEGAEKVVVMYELDDDNKKVAQNALAVKCPADKNKAQKIYDLCLTEEPQAEIIPLVSVKNEFTIHIYWE